MTDLTIRNMGLLFERNEYEAWKMVKETVQYI